MPAGAEIQGDPEFLLHIIGGYRTFGIDAMLVPGTGENVIQEVADFTKRQDRYQSLLDVAACD